jgi:hypothetical protein
MTEFLKIVALTAVLFAAQELLRRCGKWTLWGLFGLVPLVLTPDWLATNDYGWFAWLKCYTVFFCVCWPSAVRFTSVGDRPWARLSIPVLLAANNLEAVTLDVLGGNVAHGLVAVAGLILVGTIPMGHGAVTIHAGRHRDLHLPLTRGWVIGYTAWNWAFVALNFPALLGHHTAVLAAALIVGLIDPRRWLQTRACTLGLNLMMMATFDAETTAWLDASAWLDATAVLWVAAAALAVTLLALSRPLERKRLRPAPVGEPAVTAA